MPRLPTCACCGRKYRPDRFNVGHQKGCMKGSCPRERKRRRDRARYRRKYREDSLFREAEKRRRSECRRQAKGRLKAGAGPPAGGEEAGSVTELRHAVTGLAVLLAGEGDGARVGEFLRACSDRGRRLSAAMGLSP